MKTVFGQLEKGAWVRRGREGVFSGKTRQKTTTEQITEEDDGKGPFAREAQGNKLKELQSGIQKARKAREQSCNVKASPLDVQSLLALVEQTTSSGQAPGQASGLVEGDSQGQKHFRDCAGVDEKAAEDSDSSDDAMQTRQSKLRGLFSFGSSKSTTSQASTVIPKASGNAKARAKTKASAGQCAQP
eukprot:11510671-Karenia_brevis.AAC.1